jgi:uncharacterized membrane protein YdjX (TVP38/TMEM64 family)
MSGADEPGDQGYGRFLPLLALVALAALALGLGADQWLGLDWLRANRDWLRALVSERPVVTGLGFGLLYAITTALSFPTGTVLSLLAGFLFGPYAGSLIVIAGATVGAAVLFLAARTALGARFRDRFGPVLGRLAAGFERDAFGYLLFLRLVPLFPFWLVNLAPAFLGMRLTPYVAATAIGIAPACYVYVQLGGGLGRMLDTGSLDAMLSPDIMLAFGLLAALSLVPIVVRRWKASGGE